MRRFIVIGAVGLFVLTAIIAAGFSARASFSDCAKPVSLLSDEKQDAAHTVFTWARGNAIPALNSKKPETVEVAMGPRTSKSLHPNAVHLYVNVLDEPLNTPFGILGQKRKVVYAVDLSRECSGGAWKVTKAKRLLDSEKSGGGSTKPAEKS